MKRAIIISSGLLALGLLILTGTVLYSQNSQITVLAPPTQATIPLNADTIFDLVNAERVKAGVKPLVRDPILDATAQERADDMTTRNYFSHFDPVTGEKMIDRQDAGCKQSENQNRLRVDGDNNAVAVSSWMDSKSHHDAMLSKDYTHSGIAVNGNIVVQHFCNK
jgi:uncharacterized protein YkwD